MAANLQCPFPESLNPLSANGFQLTVNKLPSLTYFCQECPLPGISIEAPPQFSNLNPIPMPGDTVDFEPLVARFLVDDQMANWKAIHDWIKGIGFPEAHEQYSEFIDTQKNDQSELQKMKSDGSLLILGNNLKTLRTVKFIDLVPTGISSLEFTNTSEDVQYLTAEVTFAYSYYEFEQ